MNTVPVEIFAEEPPAIRPVQRPSPEQVRAAAEGTEFLSRQPVVPAAASPAPPAPAKGAGSAPGARCRSPVARPRKPMTSSTGSPRKELELRRHLRAGPGSPRREAARVTDQEQGRLDVLRAVYADIPIRDQRDTMERPFFSLVKRPRMVPIEYNVGGTTVRVSPSEHGIATIWDADILIWAATQIIEALDRGAEASRTIRFPPARAPERHPAAAGRRPIPQDAGRHPPPAYHHRRDQHPPAGPDEAL
jgi:hypothetical protein